MFVQPQDKHLSQTVSLHRSYRAFVATQLITKGRKQAPALQAGVGQPHAVINSAKAPQVTCQCHGIQGAVINSLSTQHKQ